MQTIFDSDAAAALDQRIARLAVDARPAWGRMNAPQMVGHLIEALRMADGQLDARPRPSILSNRIVRWLVIRVIPWPKGAPTAPELLARAPGAWDGEIDTLRALLRTIASKSPTGPWPSHPAFGAIDGPSWGLLIHRHADHHLTQFGV